MGKILRKETIENYIDSSTGEVIEQTSSKTYYERVKSEDHFFMTFIDFISPWYNLKSDTAKNILMEMCKRAAYNKGTVLLTADIREELRKQLNISAQTFSNCIRLLKDNNLISGEKGTFKINPEIFWKGDRESRKAILNDSEIQMTFKIVNESDKNKEFEQNDFK